VPWWGAYNPVREFFGYNLDFAKSTHRSRIPRKIPLRFIDIQMAAAHPTEREMFLIALRKLFRNPGEEEKIQRLFDDCERSSTPSAAHRILRETFGEETLAEYTYAGKRRKGAPVYRALSREEETKHRLRDVHFALVAHASAETGKRHVDVSDRLFADWVNYACQCARAKAKHAYDPEGMYRGRDERGVRASLFASVSASLCETFEKQVEAARGTLHRRLEDFRNELAYASDEEVETWQQRFFFEGALASYRILALSDSSDVASVLKRPRCTTD
jgi:hypothetical protein